MTRSTLSKKAVEMNVYMKLANVMLFFTFLLVSCGDTHETSLRSTKWKVEEMKLEDGTVVFPPNSYFLEFIDENAFRWKLDVNSCGGAYDSEDSGRIRMDSELGCSKACCDSPYALFMLDVVKNTEFYTIVRDRLLLKGTGVVYLKRVD